MTEAPRPKPFTPVTVEELQQAIALGVRDMRILAGDPVIPPLAPAGAPEPSGGWKRGYDEGALDVLSAESECARLRVQLQAAQATMKAAHDMLNQGTWAPAGLVQRAIDMLAPAIGDRS